MEGDAAVGVDRLDTDLAVLRQGEHRG